MGTFHVEENLEEYADYHQPSGDVRTHSSRSRISGSEQVVEFVIGNELFAVDLFDTKEVINTPEVTPIPNTPDFVTGMIDLRGVITMIIDLRAMMHINTESLGKNDPG
jgi:purine-binding chemotaxis protein CheW